ncbi:O-antigen ligase family protein [Cellulomonas marina]|uniref:O-antigen ligase n=1 Tax=Cellulomonas marina TaxID=988821 RepID=A0A1I0X3Y5_9CELL|nr:O-antigen ligase family protein [Cellulomonas marina]GIG28935.1 hypothetical protein Cma02nite_15350 [Cellulomonas marina]SFA95762.1 O-antigen ligase [Cellulomonas marina]
MLTSLRALGGRVHPYLEVGFVLAVVVGYVVPLLTDSLTGGQKSFVPITGTPEPDARLALLAGTAGDGLVLVACLVVALVHLRRWRDLVGPALLLLLAWAVQLATLAAGGGTLLKDMVLFAGIVVAVTLLRPGRAAVHALGWSTLALAVLSLLMGVLTPYAGTQVRPESVADEKFVSGFGILAGPYPSGNNLGLVLAVGLPAVLALPRPRVRWAGVVVVAVALFLTSSRTSWAAAVVAVGVWALLVLVRPGLRTRAAAAVLAAAGVVWVVLPLVTRSPTAFTNRGWYWVEGLAAWRERPWLGWGSDYYLRVAQSDGALGGFAFHAHNQVVQLLVTGGLVVALLVGSALVWAGVRAARLAPATPWAAAFLVALLVTASFEVPLGTVDRQMFYPFAALPLALVLALGRRGASADDARKGTGDAAASPARGRRVAGRRA